MPGTHGKKKKVKGYMGGGMMYKDGGKPKGSMKKKKLAAMYGNPHKITRGDIITAAKKAGKKIGKGMSGGAAKEAGKRMGQMIKKRKKK